MQGGIADFEQGFGVNNLVVYGALETSVVCGLLPGAAVDGHPEEHANVVWVVGQVGAGDPFSEFAAVYVVDLIL